MSQIKNPHQNRLEQLRKAMAREHIDVYIIYSADAHLSEYISDYWRSIKYISGFTGSAGTLVITQDFAGLWTDSRYWLMAEQQLIGTSIMLKKWHNQSSSYAQWLKNHVQEGDCIACDYQTISAADLTQLQNQFAQCQIRFKDCDLITQIHQNLPKLQFSEIYEHLPQFCGYDREYKLSKARQNLIDRQAQWQIISSLDDIAWLTNLRGSDVEYNPVFLAHILLSPTSAYLFVDIDQLSASLKQTLQASGYEILAYQSFAEHLQIIADHDIVLCELKRINAQTQAHINPKATLVDIINPVSLLKSCKTDKEVSFIKQAMREDGIALCEFFSWFENAIANKQKVSELTVDEKLTHFRSQRKDYVSNSFATIAGFKSNGAMPHYQANSDSYAEIDQSGLLLIDSGAQYLTGTTDITRVIGVGEISEAEKNDYTLVLKSHIALATAVFPINTPGQIIDAIARQPLWKVGIDFGHGTGHGVGYFLNVHEGPQVISYHSVIHENSGMKVGMVTSNEPGIYREGQWGIRLENLMVTERSDNLQTFDDSEFLHFNTITLCPFDRNCIQVTQLTTPEKNWLNNYHQIVYEVLSPFLENEALDWLKKSTKPL